MGWTELGTGKKVELGDVTVYIFRVNTNEGVQWPAMKNSTNIKLLYRKAAIHRSSNDFPGRFLLSKLGFKHKNPQFA